MSRHVSVSTTLTGKVGEVVGRVAVHNVEISHDPLRTPQIIVRARSSIATYPIWPLNREPVLLGITVRTYGTAALRDFDAAEPPATLADLSWSDRASTTVDLGGENLDLDERYYELELICTSLIQDPLTGVTDLTLASADGLLEEITNAGYEWTPEPDADGQYRLKSMMRQHLSRLNIPLEVPDTPDGDRVVAAANVHPWRMGETARAWLDDLRTAHGTIWMLSATARTIEPLHSETVWTDNYREALSEVIEIGTDFSSVTGFARWADGFQLIWRWTDANDEEHVVRDLATIHGDAWWRCRKLITEEHDTPPTGLTAQQRLARASRYASERTVTFPVTALPEPYLDLATWPQARGRMSSLTYRFPEAIAVATLIGA